MSQFNCIYFVNNSNIARITDEIFRWILALHQSLILSAVYLTMLSTSGIIQCLIWQEWTGKDVKGGGSGLISGAIYISAWRDRGKSLTVSGCIVFGERLDPDLLNMRSMATLGKILGKISESCGEGCNKGGIRALHNNEVRTLERITSAVVRASCMTLRRAGIRG
jgi:hypothetical protein